MRYSGYKSDTQVAAWTHLYVVNQMVKSLRQYQREHGSTRQESESFRKGFIVAVVKNIRQAITEKTAEMANSSSSQQLVIVKAQAVAERFGRAATKTMSASASGDAFARGHAQGSQLDVSRRGLATNNSGPALLACAA